MGWFTKSGSEWERDVERAGGKVDKYPTGRKFTGPKGSIFVGQRASAAEIEKKTGLKLR